MSEPEPESEPDPDLDPEPRPEPWSWFGSVQNGKHEFRSGLVGLVDGLTG